MLTRIFDLFTQVERSLDRSRGGLGIGLTVVRSLVELHGGSVRASSDGLGRGSRFEVRLPLSSAAPPRASPSTPPPAVRSRRVLLIEDSADIREMLGALLRDAGHRVDTTPDGPAGLEQVRAARPDVVLIDIGLPGMDGYEVARAIRAELGSDVLLAALTGYGQPGDRERARRAGFDAHLTKPVRLKALQKLLDRP
jgi:CheY-like chemotaxis protein